MKKRTVERKPDKKSDGKKPARGVQKTTQVDEELKSWHKLYVVSEHWQSDLVFFYDELNFIRKLIDKYFMSLIEEVNISRTRDIASALSALEKKRFSILQKLAHHRKAVANLMENPFAHSAQACKDEHADIEMLFAGFVKEFRHAKEDVFSLTEAIMDTEKAKHLLNG